MAIKRITVLVDDLDGSNADETVHLVLDGTAYEIDLNTFHADELRTAFAPYVEAGRKVKAGGRSIRRASTNRETDTAQIRAWAQEHGLPVSGRGRIQADIVKQYQEAHPFSG